MLYHMSTQLIDTRTAKYGLPLSDGRRRSIMTWIMFTTNDVALSVSMMYDPEGLLHEILLSEIHSGVGSLKFTMFTERVAELRFS